MRVFIFRTSGGNEQPCPPAFVERLPVASIWPLVHSPLYIYAINRKTAHTDGYLDLWAIQIEGIGDLLYLLHYNPQRDKEIVVGLVRIDDRQYHYVEIYDTWRE